MSFSQISLFFGFISWHKLRQSSTSKNQLANLQNLKFWRVNDVYGFSIFICVKTTWPRNDGLWGRESPYSRAPDVCVHATFFLYPRPNCACPVSRKLLPRSQFAKLKVDTFIFYLNGKCVLKYDWSRHLLDHYSSQAWFTKHISELKKLASSVK